MNGHHATPPTRPGAREHDGTASLVGDLQDDLAQLRVGLIHAHPVGVAAIHLETVRHRQSIPISTRSIVLEPVDAP